MLSLHDALPVSKATAGGSRCRAAGSRRCCRGGATPGTGYRGCRSSGRACTTRSSASSGATRWRTRHEAQHSPDADDRAARFHRHRVHPHVRSEEHTSELQSLMRISYAVFCLKKKKNNNTTTTIHYTVELTSRRNNTT